MIFIFHPKADEELFESAWYYEKRSVGLGEDFLAAVEKALRRIDAFPSASRADSRGIRRCAVPGFPFTVLYKHRENRVFVVAVAHHRRQPDYWIQRLIQ